GGTWRDAVDGIRPHLRNLWRGLSHDQRARFLRHGATWWDVHRHRIPPASQGRIDAAIASGQLRQLQGRFLGARRGTGDQIIAQIQPRGETNVTELTAARIVDCRGIRRDPETNATPLIADLLARGLARIDPLRIGLDVTLHCRVINRDGKPSRQIYAIGPVSRAAFWEITAIPDIREQTARLSSELAVR
ncbi:MAG: FAD-dependent oxidoreductase, partial [Paracoccaceae bacterium]|nr:FAD-dependent oxidoreductase [Paracoccaceae bacterium]